MSISSMTELEAVNLMLTNIGEAPVNTIEGTNMLDIAIAKQVLREVLIEVQEPGWDFNTESGITITPNEDGEIWFPINALRVDPVDRSLKVVMRGHRLYDKENHTYEFSGPVDVEIVFGLEFEQCPQALRQYVAIKVHAFISAARWVLTCSKNSPKPTSTTHSSSSITLTPTRPTTTC